MIRFLLQNPKTADKMKTEQMIALDILGDLLKTEGQRKHELEYASSGRDQILIKSNDGRQAQFVVSESGKVFLLVDGVVYPIANELVEEAVGRRSDSSAEKDLLAIDASSIREWFDVPKTGREPTFSSICPLFAFKWSEDFDGDGDLGFQEFRQVKQTFYSNENFFIAIPYRTASHINFVDVVWTIYNAYTGAVVKSGSGYSLGSVFGAIIKIEIGSNELRIGRYTANAKLVIDEDVVAANNADFEVIEGNSSTAEVSLLESKYREKHIANSTPIGLFFSNSWQDSNQDGIFDSTEFRGLNSESYSASQDTIQLSINVPDKQGELIIQAWSSDGTLVLTRMARYQAVMLVQLNPGDLPMESAEVLGSKFLSKSTDYKVSVTFVDGGTFERNLTLIR